MHARTLELLVAQEARLKQAEGLVEQELKRLDEELAHERDQLDRLRSERDMLAARLTQFEAGGAVVPLSPLELAGPDSGGADTDEYRRRYELAASDLEELKARNSALQRQLDDARQAAAALATQSQAPSGRLDWEAEKRRTLAALESETDQHDASQCGERLKIEEMLHSTEQIIGEKDRQIRELTQQVEAQRGNIEASAPANAALDADAAIQEERKRLNQLQEEWREKLRQAEIEVSLERAKLARQRAEMEERLQAAQADPHKSAPPAAPSGRAERRSSGRWLARLGLTDTDVEKGKHRS